MNLITTNLPRYSDGEIDRALMRELQTGMELKKQMERKREIQAEAQARELRGHKTINGLGKCVASMPSWEFFRLVQKYGHAEVHSEGFLRDFQRRFPHLSPNKI